MPVRAITFDFWSTLFRDANSEPRQKVRVDACASATGLPADTVASALRITWAEFDRSHREDQRTLTARDAVRMTCGALRVPLASEAAAELSEVFATAILRHSPEPIEGALDAVRAAASFVPVGVVSDAGVSPGSSLRALLERHGFLDSFRSLTFSDDVGVSKPQRAMFEHAARGLGCAPEELLHIGDLEYTDVAGAHAVGAKAALFAGENARYRSISKADFVFDSWREFIDALPGLFGGAMPRR